MTITVDLGLVRAITQTVLEDESLLLIADLAASQVAACSAYDEEPERQRLLALYLTAHLVLQVDPHEISAKLMDGTTIAFPQGKQGRGLANSHWGQLVLNLDPHGCIAGSDSGAVRIMSLPAPRHGGC